MGMVRGAERAEEAVQPGRGGRVEAGVAGGRAGSRHLRMGKVDVG